MAHIFCNTILLPIEGRCERISTITKLKPETLHVTSHRLGFHGLGKNVRGILTAFEFLIMYCALSCFLLDPQIRDSKVSDPPQSLSLHHPNGSDRVRLNN